MLKKANTRLFFLKQLKRAKVSPSDIVATYLAIVRPVLEYACQVWHPGLMQEQRVSIEKSQERALRIAFPGLSYEHAHDTCNVPTLEHRRTDLCERLFNDIKSDTHTLHSLLPPARERAYSTRNSQDYPLPVMKAQN